MHHNRCLPALACKIYWRYRRVSELMPNGMRSMSLKSSSLPPIESKLWSKALGETSLQPPPVILSSAAERRARSHLRKPTRGDPRRSRDAPVVECSASEERLAPTCSDKPAHHRRNPTRRA